MERVPTGIKGLDDLIGGGFPKGSTILVTGGPGTGKTTFGMNFLVSGCLKFKEKGLYISLEEDIERVRRSMEISFNWPLGQLIKKGFLKMVKAELYDFDKLRMLIEDEVESIKAERLVIDPITILSLYFENPLEIRRGIIRLDKMLKKMGCTTILTCEIPEGMSGISSFGVEEFTSDGIIILKLFQKKGKYFRTLTIRKMRATKHEIGLHPMEITKDGIVVKKRCIVI